MITYYVLIIYYYRQSITMGTSQLPVDSTSVDVIEKDIITSVGALMLK